MVPLDPKPSLTGSCSLQRREAETAALSREECSHSVAAFSFFSFSFFLQADDTKSAVNKDFRFYLTAGCFYFSGWRLMLLTCSLSSLQYWHKGCFSCEVCKMALSMTTYKGFEKKPYCSMWVSSWSQRLNVSWPSITLLLCRKSSLTCGVFHHKPNMLWHE